MNLLIVLSFLVMGFFLIIKGSLHQKEKEKIIEYRYVPRTFEEEQKEPVMVMDLFYKMFQQSSVLPNKI